VCCVLVVHVDSRVPARPLVVFGVCSFPACACRQGLGELARCGRKQASAVAATLFSALSGGGNGPGDGEEDELGGLSGGDDSAPGAAAGAAAAAAAAAAAGAAGGGHCGENEEEDDEYSADEQDGAVAPAEPAEPDDDYNTEYFPEGSASAGFPAAKALDFDTNLPQHQQHRSPPRKAGALGAALDASRAAAALVVLYVDLPVPPRANTKVL